MGDNERKVLLHWTGKQSMESRTKSDRDIVSLNFN